MNRQFGLPTFSFHHSAHQVAVAVVVVSVLFGLFGQMGGAFLLLSPAAVLDGFQAWRPFTYVLVATNPMEVIFGALIIYSIGGTLEAWLGRGGFLAVALGIPFASGVLTLLAALMLPSMFMLTIYAGASCIITTVWIVFGLNAHLRRQTLNFWGVPLSGKNFALIGLGFVLLQGVFSSFLTVIPELFGAALSYAYVLKPGVFEPFRRVELAYYNWKLKRLKAKRGLRVVKSSSSRKDDEGNSQIH